MASGPCTTTRNVTPEVIGPNVAHLRSKRSHIWLQGMYDFVDDRPIVSSGDSSHAIRIRSRQRYDMAVTRQSLLLTHGQPTLDICPVTKDGRVRGAQPGGARAHGEALVRRVAERRIAARDVRA